MYNCISRIYVFTACLCTIQMHNIYIFDTLCTIDICTTTPPIGGPSHKHPSSKDKGKTVSSQSPSPHIYNPPPPTCSQSPSIQFPLSIYPQHAYASSTYAPFSYSQPTYAPQAFPQPIYTQFSYSQPIYAPMTNPPLIYPLSAELSHKLPQLCAMPNRDPKVSTGAFSG